MKTLALGALVVTLAGCSAVSVQSQVRPDAGGRMAAMAARTLVVVSLNGEVRRVAEDSLVANLASLHPTASYPSVSLVDGLTLAALRDRARKDGFDNLLVVWPKEIGKKSFSALAAEPPGIHSSSQVSVQFAASLTSLDGDREIWKAVLTAHDAVTIDKTAADTIVALAKRLHDDGIAN